MHGWGMWGRAVEQQLVIIQEDNGFHLYGDYEQLIKVGQIDKLKRPMTLTQFLNNTTLLTTFSQMTLLQINSPIESDCFWTIVSENKELKLVHLPEM